jgi:putative pyrroloquinoline-quinone binding quinoprotein
MKPPGTLSLRIAAGVLACAVAGSVAVAVAVAAGDAAPVSTSSVAWTDPDIHVVGGPVAAGGRALVLVVAPNRSVFLEAVDPRTGAVRWKLPAGFSEITAGVASEPLAHGGVALALVPAAGATSALVRIEGVSIATGAVAWRSHLPVLVTDAPTMCPPPLGARAFCIVAGAAPSSPTGLIALSPRTGAVLATVPNIERLMSVQAGLYEAYDVRSILSEVRMPGGAVWSKGVSGLFGSGYDPNYGWDFGRYGSLEVGSVGNKPTGRTIELGASKAIGLSQATGDVVWTRPGAFQCYGSAGLLAPYLCLMTGTATPTAAGAFATSKDATMTLEGLDPKTGRITWRQKVGAIPDMLLGNVAIDGASRQVVASPQGKKLVLDLLTGSTRVPGAREAFWCARFNLFRIRPAKGLSAERVGSSRYTSCDSRKHAVAGVAPPSSVAGVTVGKMFVWASTQGLEAVAQH